MYRTLSPGSPWVKMTSARRYSTIFLAIPAERRNAWALNVPFLVAAMARPLKTSGPADEGVDASDGRRTWEACRVRCASTEGPGVGPRGRPASEEGRDDES